MSERKLQDADVLAELGWREVAEEMVIWGWALETETEIHGTRLADAVIAEQLTLDALKMGVVWAGAHASEARQKLTGIEAAERQDQFESAARHLAHASGRWALIRVCREEDRLRYAQERRRQRQHSTSAGSVGLFSLEAKDRRENMSRIRIA